MDADEKRKDNISHWVLRLAFAASEDTRRRYLAFELLLFRHRFEHQASARDRKGRVCVCVERVSA